MPFKYTYYSDKPVSYYSDKPNKKIREQIIRRAIKFNCFATLFIVTIVLGLSYLYCFTLSHEIKEEKEKTNTYVYYDEHKQHINSFCYGSGLNTKECFCSFRAIIHEGKDNDRDMIVYAAEMGDLSLYLNIINKFRETNKEFNGYKESCIRGY